MIFKLKYLQSAFQRQIVNFGFMFWEMNFSAIYGLDMSERFFYNFDVLDVCPLSSFIMLYVS